MFCVSKANWNEDNSTGIYQPKTKIKCSEHKIKIIWNEIAKLKRRRREAKTKIPFPPHQFDTPIRPYFKKKEKNNHNSNDGSQIRTRHFNLLLYYIIIIFIKIWNFSVFFFLFFFYFILFYFNFLLSSLFLKKILFCIF